jgi:hypothetical protein
LNGDWYCSRQCVRLAARADLDPGLTGGGRAPMVPSRLGALLRHLEGLSEEALNAALESQRRTRRRLGAELVSQGSLRPAQVLRALAAQGNVSYLAAFDLARVAAAASWLPVDAVRALRLVPFDVAEGERRVRVVCAAPVPRAAVRAVQTLTGLSPEVFLIEDDVWQRALARYCATRTGREVVTVGGLDDAAALVADAASSEREVTMRHARWDAYTWVRVEGPTQVSHVLVPAMEESCQVAPTPR